MWDILFGLSRLSSCRSLCEDLGWPRMSTSTPTVCRVIAQSHRIKSLKGHSSTCLWGPGRVPNRSLDCRQLMGACRLGPSKEFRQMCGVAPNKLLADAGSSPCAALKHQPNLQYPAERVKKGPGPTSPPLRLRKPAHWSLVQGMIVCLDHLSPLSGLLNLSSKMVPLLGSNI